MLKKILKYDLKNVYKLLIVFYILAIFFGICTRMFSIIENSILTEIISQICMGTAFSMMASSLINTLMRSWVIFRNNFYGDESYLTHTLPMSKKTLYLSKFISSFIVLFTSIVVCFVTLFIMFYSKENLEMIKNILLPISNIYNVNIFILIIGIVFILFLEFANILQCGYTGLILGYRMNNNKTLFSVIYGFISGIITQLIVLIIILILSIFNSELSNIIFTNEMVSVRAIKTIIYLSMVIYIFIIVIIYSINNKLFNKGVNVE